MDWATRAAAAADRFVPWLVGLAPQLRDYVQDVLNAPALIRRMWATLRPSLGVPVGTLTEFERLLELDEVLRESVTGEAVSAVVTRYLLDNAGHLTLGKNGRSDYPDVYLADPGLYSQLPAFARKGKQKAKGKPADQYGAALKANRPVRVPDGLEIKTCRERIAVDCHFPHDGLHLVLLFSESNAVYSVKDILVAFLNRADYRQSKRNTAATTVKYSFGSSQFKSVLP